MTWDWLSFVIGVISLPILAIIGVFGSAYLLRIKDKIQELMEKK